MCDFFFMLQFQPFKINVQSPRFASVRGSQDTPGLGPPPASDQFTSAVIPERSAPPGLSEQEIRADAQSLIERVLALLTGEKVEPQTPDISFEECPETWLPSQALSIQMPSELLQLKSPVLPDYWTTGDYPGRISPRHVHNFTQAQSDRHPSDKLSERQKRQNMESAQAAFLTIIKDPVATCYDKEMSYLGLAKIASRAKYGKLVREYLNNALYSTYPNLDPITENPFVLVFAACSPEMGWTDTDRSTILKNVLERKDVPPFSKLQALLGLVQYSVQTSGQSDEDYRKMKVTYLKQATSLCYAIISTKSTSYEVESTWQKLTEAIPKRYLSLKLDSQARITCFAQEYLECVKYLGAADPAAHVLQLLREQLEQSGRDKEASILDRLAFARTPVSSLPPRVVDSKTVAEIRTDLRPVLEGTSSIADFEKSDALDSVIAQRAQATRSDEELDKVLSDVVGKAINRKEYSNSSPVQLALAADAALKGNFEAEQGFLRAAQEIAPSSLHVLTDIALRGVLPETDRAALLFKLKDKLESEKNSQNRSSASFALLRAKIDTGLARYASALSSAERVQFIESAHKALVDYKDKYPRVYYQTPLILIENRICLANQVLAQEKYECALFQCLSIAQQASSEKHTAGLFESSITGMIVSLYGLGRPEEAELYRTLLEDYKSYHASA
jgi:hypothetical protein